MTKRMNFDFSDNEIIVDLFAGGGGASTGIEMALGRSPDIAINHDPEAIALHQANHPDTLHIINDVFELNPHNVSIGRPVGLLWISPDCKHFSKAKGGKPKSKKIRSLAWVGVKWARAKRPRVIMLENVEEFQEWGPLKCDGTVCDLRRGKTFRLFVSKLERLGYKVEWRELRACDYGAPTIRKRLFMIARRDGEPIIWPEPTHGDPKSEAVKSGELQPWVGVNKCLDFSLPTPSIFLTKEEGKKVGVRRPLAENTMRRIAKGLKKYVLDNKEPFIVTANHSGKYFRGQGLCEPFKTITAANDAHGLVIPFVSTYYGAHKNGKGDDRGSNIDSPVATITAGGMRHALVTAFMAQHNLGNVGRSVGEPISTLTTSGSQQQLVAAHIKRDFGASIGHGLLDPAGTITAGGNGKMSLVTSNIMKMRGTNIGHGTDEPLHTITASGSHHAEVRAFLMKYYGTGEGQDITDPAHTITTKDRFGLVTVHGEL